MRGGEARKITDAPGAGVEQFAWKPDGTEIAYVAADEPENKKDIEAHNDAFEVGDDGYLTTAAPTPSHIWIVSADGGAARRLTHGAWSLAKSQPPGPPSSPLSWSPDGTALPPRSASSWATSARRGRSGWTRRSTGTGRSPSPAARRVGRRSCIT